MKRVIKANIDMIDGGSVTHTLWFSSRAASLRTLNQLGNPRCYGNDDSTTASMGIPLLDKVTKTKNIKISFFAGMWYLGSLRWLVCAVSPTVIQPHKFGKWNFVNVVERQFAHTSELTTMWESLRQLSAILKQFHDVVVSDIRPPHN